MSEEKDIAAALVLMDDFTDSNSPFNFTTFMGVDLLPAIHSVFGHGENKTAAIVFDKLCQEKQADFPFIVLILKHMDATPNVVGNTFLGEACNEDINRFVELVAKDDRSLLVWSAPKKKAHHATPVKAGVVEIPIEGRPQQGVRELSNVRRLDVG